MCFSLFGHVQAYPQSAARVLSAVLPVLHSLGVQVVDQRPYEIRRSDGTIYLYDFGLQPPAAHRELAEVRPQVENAFAATWRGEAEVDGYNELVLRAGLTWRQVVVLNVAPGLIVAALMLVFLGGIRLGAKRAQAEAQSLSDYARGLRELLRNRSLMLLSTGSGVGCTASST